jgi:hypothetical protein
MDRRRKLRTPHAITDGERRASVRYSLKLDLRYTAEAGHAPVTVGTGKTTNVSSSGLSFTGDTPLLAGQNVKVYIDWPVMLDGSVKLQLEIWGVVVRVDGTNFAIQIEKHHFKTRSARQRLA